jgi:acylphosphatase
MITLTQAQALNPASYFHFMHHRRRPRYLGELAHRKRKTLMHGLQIHITGIVQGVGFRPFVYNLAARLKLNGWVRNTSAGVDIEVDGNQDILDAFVKALRDEAPPLSRIDELTASFRPANGFRSFDILHSEAVEGAFQPISPMLPSAMIACENSSTQTTGVIAIPSSTAPTADRASLSSRIFPTTAPKQQWRDSSYAPTVNANTPTQQIAGSTHSQWHVLFADQKSRLKV